MLTIAKLGVGQEAYYLTKVARGIEDYYTGHGETPGGWLGRGASRLGLTGDVTGAQLRSALAGLDPVSGDRLAGRTGAKRVPGWDLTFCAPKSVSVLFALGGAGLARQVVGAHETAVAEAIGYLERHATVSRRRSGRRIEQVRAEGLVIAGFRHRTSRAGDPHLHTHALAANMVERIDGGWGALHSPVIYRHARTAGFVYQAILRSELTERLGVQWGTIHNGYGEIAGIDRRLLEGFSKRHTEIEAELDGASEASARAAEVAQRRTKSAKEYGVDPDTLYQRWHAEARTLGVDPQELIPSVTGGGAPTVAEADVQWTIDQMVAPWGLTARQATFDRRDVTRAWCEALPPGVKVSLDTLEALTDTALVDPALVAVVTPPPTVAALEPAVRADGSETAAVVADRRWSTTEMLAVEQRVLQLAEASQGAGAGRIDAELIDQHLDQRRDLSPEQTDLVRRLTTSGDAVEVVVGRAGTGKNYALAAAADLWRNAGYRPIGVALAARAAAELETTAGIASATVAQFLVDADQAPGGLVNQRHVVIVDEASMVDTRRLARVIRHVDAAGAKVVLVGDHHQLPAVEAGGAFAALVRRLGAIELTENRRQRDIWERHTLDRLRTGDGGRHGIADVVASYGGHGRLHLGATPAEVRAAMVADWYDARQAGVRVAMIALRRSDVAELNCRARALLVADGDVAASGIKIAHRTFAIGDRVVCLSNDRRVGVHNALFGQVVAVDADGGSLTMHAAGSGQRIVIPASYMADGHLDHAYATTLHKAQGATYDRTLLLGDDRLYRQAGYTGLSRGRDRNDMYLVDDDDRDRDPDLDRHGHEPPEEPIARLVAALHRDGAKHLATDDVATDERDIASLQPLSELWSVRDELAARLAAIIPPDHTGTLGVLTDATEQARLKAAQAALARSTAEERAQGASGRRRGKALARNQLGQAIAYEQRLLTEWRELDEQRAALESQHAERAAVLHAHDQERRRLQGLDRAIQRRTRAAGRAAEIDRPRQLIAILGEPPTSIDARQRWRAAAGAIESYHARWEVDVDDNPDKLAGDQLADLAEVQQRVASVADPAGPTIDVGELSLA